MQFFCILRIRDNTVPTAFLFIQYADYAKRVTEKYIYTLKMFTNMWANAQRDGRPTKYRWRPLFNAAKFG